MSRLVTSLTLFVSLALSAQSFTEEEWLNAIVRSVERSEVGIDLEEDGNYYSPRPVTFEICYDELGCFDKSIGGRHPSRPQDVPTWFSLNTVDNQINITWQADEEYLHANVSELFQEERPLVIVAHGFSGDLKEKWMWQMNEAILSAYPNAVTMLMDWGKGAYFPLYLRAASNVPLVAKMTSKLVTRMMKVFPTIKAENIHFVGFSLGGQIAGYFAKNFAQVTEQRIGRITCLDLAAPLFEVINVKPDRCDADFVEGIHTSAGDNLLKGLVGYIKPYGNVDYYINGGVMQPNCSIWNINCHHNRAREYFIDALLHLDSCQMKGNRCESVKHANLDQCNGDEHETHVGTTNFRTYLADIKARGKSHSQRIVRVETTGSAPFCKAD